MVDDIINRRRGKQEAEDEIPLMGRGELSLMASRCRKVARRVADHSPLIPDLANIVAEYAVELPPPDIPRNRRGAFSDLRVVIDLEAAECEEFDEAEFARVTAELAKLNKLGPVIGDL